MYRIIIDFLERLALEVGAVARWRVRHIGRTVHGADDIVGVEVAAIVKFHAPAQLELPGQVIDRLPRFRETRRQALSFILCNQPVEDMDRHRVVGAEVVEVGVH